MAVFDRIGRLRKALSPQRVHSGRKEILSYLKGRLIKEDPPAVIAEPASEDEIKYCLEFADDRHMKVAVADGLSPAAVSGLRGQMLLLTSKLTGDLVFSEDKTVVRVPAGIAAEKLSLGLSDRRVRWLPLHPVPTATSLGSLICEGWEGLRNWSGGGTLSHLGSVEWMSYEGGSYVTRLTDGNPDVTPFLFGSRGTLGILTSVELLLEPVPDTRTVVLFELPDAGAAVNLMAELRTVDPLPRCVVYWGRTAAALLRNGNDGTVSDRAVVLLLAEWDGNIGSLPEEWQKIGKPVHQPQAVESLWQDVLRLPRITARLHPHRLSERFYVPPEAVPDLEERVEDLGRESNFGLCLWGTAGAGHIHVRILLPDGETLTRRRAGDVLRKLTEDVIRLGGSSGSSAESDISRAVRDLLLKRGDPAAMHQPLRN